MKKLLTILYIIDIYIILSSSYTLLKWKMAEIENNSVILVGIIGMNQIKGALIISILIFIILTVIFIKNKKKK